jgi:TfoX/Sxy family transcriptional regulator of competence genes
MAYDEDLAARVRALLAGRVEVSERQMFGGLTFMIEGNMCCGVNGDELIVRLDPDREDEALARPHRPTDGLHRSKDAWLHHGAAARGSEQQPPESVARRSRCASRIAPAQVAQVVGARCEYVRDFKQTPHHRADAAAWFRSRRRSSALGGAPAW